MTRLLNVAKKVLWASVVGVVLFVGAMAYLSPETESYTSNIDDAPLPTRTLVPRDTTTTTTARAMSAVSAEKVTDEIVIIDRDRVIRLPRSANVTLYLWLATYAYQ